jgi:serine protease Do
LAAISGLDELTALVVCRDISSRGSGFVIPSDGHVLTNAHVVSRTDVGNDGAVIVRYSQDIAVQLGGEVFPGELVTDPDDPTPVVFDYAMLKIDARRHLPYLRLGEATQLQQGDEVWCAGFPLDFNRRGVSS